MDAFEQLASDVFWADGYWVWTGVKVALSREEKLRIGRHSAPRYAHRSKLFHDAVLRDTILGALKADFVARGLCPADVTVRLGLVHAHATSSNAARLADHFDKNGWLLFGRSWLHGQPYHHTAGSNTRLTSV